MDLFLLAAKRGSKIFGGYQKRKQNLNRGQSGAAKRSTLFWQPPIALFVKILLPLLGASRRKRPSPRKVPQKSWVMLRDMRTLAVLILALAIPGNAVPFKQKAAANAVPMQPDIATHHLAAVKSAEVMRRPDALLPK
jgi:hypothetical protein